MSLNLANLSNEDLLRIALTSGDATSKIKRVRKTGYHSRNATAWETTWPNTTTRPWRKPSDTAEKITITSSDAQDTDVTGSGAWAFFVDGIDADGNPQSETVRMAGAGGVDTVGTYKDANVYAVTEGATEDAVNVGNISATGKTSGKLLAYIPAGECRDNQAVATVWGKGRGVILGAVAEADAQGFTSLLLREPGGVWQRRNRWHAGIAGTMLADTASPIVVAAGTQIETASLHSAAATISAAFELLMFDET